MTLRITRGSDPIRVSNITACIYAVPGIGKTTLGFTADSPLLLDFDKGAYRAGNRGDTVVVERWDDVESISQADLAGYKTVVVDTAGRALDSLTQWIIARNPKMGRGGALTLQGFGELKACFTAWTRLLRGFGLDVVLIAHSDEQRQGDELIERLDMQGGSKNEVYKSSDVMGRLYLRDGRRWLNFSPTDTSFGKNPAQLSPLAVPGFVEAPHFLGVVLARIKNALNALSDQQVKVAGLLADWKARIDEGRDKAHFDALLPEVQQADPMVLDNVKRLLRQAAHTAGLAYSETTKGFEPKAAA